MKHRMFVAGMVIALAVALLPAPASAAPAEWGGGGRWVVALTNNAPVVVNGHVKMVPFRTEMGVVSVNGATAVVSNDGSQTVNLYGGQWGELASGALYTYAQIAPDICGQGQVCAPTFIPRPRGWGESWIYTGGQATYQRCRTEYVWQRSGSGWLGVWRQVPREVCSTEIVYGVREISSGENGVTMTPW